MADYSFDSLKQASSVATQLTKTFSSNINEIGGSVSGSLSNLSSSLGSTLNNINSATSKLGSLGMSVGGSITGALSQLSELGNYSKFKDKFVPPSKSLVLNGLSPEQTRQKPLAGYSFPRDIGKYFITFTFSEFKRKVPMSTRTKLDRAIINLPIPANLGEQFGMQYADKQLGAFGYLLKQGGDIIEAAGTPGQEGLNKLQDLGKDIGKTVTSKEGIYYGARTLAGLSDSAGAVADIATGTILNPYQSLVFQGVSLRSHQFTFRLSPNSKDESSDLKNIIRTFKERMHPEKTALTYNFPDVCEISFGGFNEDPYKFKLCFLESMSVNYAPNGVPAFFAQTNDPVEVEISLTFKEIEPLTRTDFSDYTGE